VEWAAARPAPEASHQALVIGCGLGEDAAHLSELGWGVTAFDISPSAIRAARRRFPTVPADFRVADLLNPPKEWTGRFDLVLDTYTTQSLPVRLRPTITRHIRRFVAVGGTLLLLAVAEDEHSATGPPWPLTRKEVTEFAGDGLRLVAIEELRTPPEVRQWRAQFERVS
jgi:SAM-dependent methyltransferase